MMDHSNILQLRPSQIEEASELAAHALISDPVFSNLTPDDPELRFQALTWLTSRLMAYCIQYGYTYTTSDIQGVAVWLPPAGEVSSHWLQQIKMALQLKVYQLPVKVGWNRLARWLKVLSAIEKAQQQDMGESPYWDLGLMVVHPDSQGQGIGTRLLEPILLQASKEGLPCSVVTATELAVRFYQKNGFEITRKQQIAADAPSFWILKRHP
ncbi:GNAT family N-acetyltransferase [Acaryochloris marina]|nr:GNAT family N-acetyltransferase [Acaryochloris marina]